MVAPVQWWNGSIDRSLRMGRPDKSKETAFFLLNCWGDDFLVVSDSMLVLRIMFHVWLAAGGWSDRDESRV